MDTHAIDALIERAAATALARPHVLAVATSAPPSALREAFGLALQRRGPHAATVLAFALAAAGESIPREPLLELLADLADIKHLGPLVAAAEGDRVALVMELVDRGRASWEREALALFLATRLLDGRPAPPALQSRLRVMARQPIPLEARMLLGLALRTTGEPSLVALAAQLIPSLTPQRHAEIVETYAALLAPGALEALPEREPPRVVSGYTLVRTTPKIGRNDPCHCGSGKKYKRCCAAKDQERGMESPSEILAGMGDGHTRLRNQLVEQLRPSELARIDPARIGTHELVDAIRRLSTHRRWDVVAQFADELSRRTDVPAPVADYHDEIAYEAFEAGAIDVAVRHFELSEPDEDQRAAFELKLALARRSPDALARLESVLEATLRGDHAGPLIDAAHAVLDSYPALGILVARGAISAERPFDSEVLLEAIGEARDRMLIDPHEPWWGVLDVLMTSREEEAAVSASRSNDAAAQARWREEVEQLRASQREAEARASAMQRELERSREEFERLRVEQHRLAAETTPAREAEPEPAARAGELERECRRLKRAVDELEHAVASGAEQRAELRRELRRAMTNNRRAGAELPVRATAVAGDDGGEAAEAADVPRRLLVPRYGGAVAKALGELPRTTGAHALRVIASLAGGDALAWAGVKRMRSAPDTFSARVGLSHRLLFRVAAEQLEVVEILARKDLETALRRR